MSVVEGPRRGAEQIQADGQPIHELAESLSLVRQGMQLGGLVPASPQPVHIVEIGRSHRTYPLTGVCTFSTNRASLAGRLNCCPSGVPSLTWSWGS